MRLTAHADATATPGGRVRGIENGQVEDNQPGDNQRRDAVLDDVRHQRKQRVPHQHDDNQKDAADKRQHHLPQQVAVQTFHKFFCRRFISAASTMRAYCATSWILKSLMSRLAVVSPVVSTAVWGFPLPSETATSPVGSMFKLLFKLIDDCTGPFAMLRTMRVHIFAVVADLICLIKRIKRFVWNKSVRRKWYNVGCDHIDFYILDVVSSLHRRLPE